MSACWLPLKITLSSNLVDLSCFSPFHSIYLSILSIPYYIFRGQSPSFSKPRQVQASINSIVTGISCTYFRSHILKLEKNISTEEAEIIRELGKELDMVHLKALKVTSTPIPTFLANLSYRSAPSSQHFNV